MVTHLAQNYLVDSQMSTFQIKSYLFFMNCVGTVLRCMFFMGKQRVMTNLNKEVSADEVSGSCGARPR